MFVPFFGYQGYLVKRVCFEGFWFLVFGVRFLDRKWYTDLTD
ncbi:hypothetical protein FPSM_00548 [Flavobacterium psychrophilum]|nr:hypothetical protein FPSM_00548 [Flavobacterium psychrophilum]